ncbi:hypothetical protein SY83_09115 [Paenibacillus swuensis]|uniref:Maltodextrin-binding protein n=1 Tax=Paenibacillus swuensis TaxID=1178515 RepID=A0A172THH0_9BACL|nr:extracellular solute-binding protein [Paenibacillus swuensis]ANE46412.1 hypothetical protein SY83_09115 [Paenibacillus swuensis]
MKGNVKKSMLLLLTLIMAFTVTACGAGNGNSTKENNTATNEGNKNTEPAAEGKTKLRIYAQYSDEDTKTPFDYAKAELAKEMPNVELELDIQAQDDGQKLKTYAATGNLPDIFQAGLDIINTFKKSENILVLDDYVTSTGFKDKMLPSAMNTLTHEDGHSYAFPYAGNELILLYYNKELFEKNGVKVPTTYEEFLDAVKKFKAADVTPMSMFAKEKWPTVALFDMFATRSNPAGITALDQGKAKASDEAFKSAAMKVEELVKAGLLSKGATNMNYDQAAALFHEGKAAMFLNGQWEIEAATKALGDKVGYMYYPANSAADVDATKLAFSGGGGPGGYAVSPSTKDKELAAKVAAFMSLKYAEFKYTQRGNPMVATKVDLPVVKKFPPMMEQLAKDIPNITSTSAFAWGLADAKVKAAIEDSSQNLMTGSYTADDFVADVDAVVGAK